jgi:hypothetical protein
MPLLAYTTNGMASISYHLRIDNERAKMDPKDLTSDLFPFHLRPARLDFFPCVVAFAPQLILLEVEVIQLVHP